jgi:signal transduction histidine kinase/ABC-type amino acid transport substrate-binding protein/CheY-like chemotaxis protein
MFCALAGFAAAAPPGRPDAPAGGPKTLAELAQRQPIVVGAYTDAYPYSYLESNGRLSGFSVDVADAVARAVGIRIERVSAPAAQIRERFEKGEFDMLQYLAMSRARRLTMDFSVPILSLQGCIYVRQDGPIHELRDLGGQPFGTIGSSGQGERILKDNGVRAQIVRVAGQEDLLRGVSMGRFAACFLSQLSEVALSGRLGITGVRVLGRPYNGYEVRQAFAVHLGDSELLARLNEGLATIHHTGEFDRIYRRHFGQFGSYIVSASDLEFYASVALFLALVVAVLGYFRQRYLRKALSVQALQLAEQGALLRALYDNVPMAMTVVEAGPPGPRVLTMNRHACDLYSIAFAGTATPLDSLPLSDDVRMHLREAISGRPDAGSASTRETLLEAGRRLLEVIAVPLTAPGGLPNERICILVEDITERTRQEAEVVRSRKLRAVGELVGGIAHEFNNLLTPVMLKAGEIQLSRPDDAELQGNVEVIIQAVQRTAELTRRLLAFGRKAEVRAEAVRLSSIAAGCFDLLKHTVDRRITWEQKIPDDLPPLYFNATDLNQILLNLLLNSRDALMERMSGPNPPGWVPTITIEAAQLPAGAFEPHVAHGGKPLLGWQRITVRDNGIGMKPEVLERIFEPFYTTKDVGKGTGLGLATMWHMVTAAGGQVKVESSGGTGSEFHIFLPVWPAEEKPKPPAARPAEARAVRVLLIEDESLVALPIIQILVRNGHEIRHFDNGLEAWRHLEENLGSYELLIIDVNMPGMSGVDIVARARERSFPGRIFMVSGRFTSSDMSALTRLGIDHSLTKPFDVQQFLQAVNESLKAGNAGEAPPGQS